jgi:hypothetical protein
MESEVFKIRYELATGRVNLITNGQKEIRVDGCRYMTLKRYPWFDDQKETLYVRDGRIIAVTVVPHPRRGRDDEAFEPPLHRIVEGVL